MRYYLVVLLLALAGETLSDNPEKSPKVTGTVEKVPVDATVNHKSGSVPPSSAPFASPTYPSGGVSPSYPGAASADVGGSSQGYYYYYYPVVNKEDTDAGHYAGEVDGGSDGGGLGGLLAGKGLLIALAIGAVIVLAVAGTTINLNNGRSIQDLTLAASEKLDVLTGLVVDAIDLYDSVN